MDNTDYNKNKTMRMFVVLFFMYMSVNYYFCVVFAINFIFKTSESKIMAIL
jgi:hypothetical protein